MAQCTYEKFEEYVTAQRPIQIQVDEIVDEGA